MRSARSGRLARRLGVAVVLGVATILGPKTDPSLHWATSPVAAATTLHEATADLPGGLGAPSGPAADNAFDEA